MKTLARQRFSKLLALAIAVAMIGGVTLAGVALGDTLELRNGQIFQGEFIGGSPLNIRFRVNGKEKIFPTKDVLDIGFDNTTAASQTPETTSPTPVPARRSTATASTSDVSGAPSRQTAPSAGTVTIPAGASLLVRMIDSVDSSTNKIGDPFHASLETPLVVGGQVIAPKGADVYGKLAQAKEAGKISGAAQLTLELTGIRIDGNIVPIDSTDYEVAGKGRGKQSAERIGGGAVLGAIIGGIAGGGKGAAVGAGVGAGAGTAAQVLTHGQQVRVPSETLLEFKLQQAVTARVGNPAH